MYLDEKDKELFFKLYFDLLYCTNQTHKFVEDFSNTRYPKSINTEKAYEIREKIFEEPTLIDEYLCTYGEEMSLEEKDILISWRDHFIKDQFFVMRNLVKYSVFMSAGNEDTTRLYGIIGLNHPVADLFEKKGLPYIINAILLPFNGKIIYDGIFSAYNIQIGPGMRNNLNDLYKASKNHYGIIESLPFDESSRERIKKTVLKKSTAKPTGKKEEKVDEIKARITHFCKKKMNSDFLDVSLYVLEKLRRKRPSPLQSGRVNTWACGIVYAVASNNFVFDRAQTYYMSAQDIADGFGLSKGTAQSKAAEIKKMLKIDYFKPKYLIPDLRKSSNEMLDMMHRIDNMW